MKEYNDQITNLDPRRELPSMVRYLSADRLAGIIEEAQNGDTRELFALYRDVISNDNQVRSEFFKRKIAVLGDPVSVVPFKKGDQSDIDAAALCGEVLDNPTFADAESWLMNATLYPVAVVEKVFEPLPGGGFALKALVPVHYQLLDYSQGAMRVFDVDDTGTPLPTSHEVTPERYIVHRCDLMPAPDNWGGAMRSILFWWLLRTMSRQWWADLLERFGVPFLKGKYSDEKGRSTLERAFKLAVRLGAIVVSKNTEVEVVQAASGDASNSHERFITICNQEISKLIVGQTLSSSASPTGELGGGTANLQGEVRDDIRKADAKSLAATFRGQLFDQLLAINGQTGRSPKILFGSESIAEQKATLTLIKELHGAGLEPDDNALDTISERIGFGIRRAAVPQSPMLPFSASIPIPGVPTSLAPTTVPLSAGDSVEDRPAASSAEDLTRAFAADLAPIKDIIAASTSPDDCIRRVEAWVARHNPSNAAEVIEKALYVYSMAGARSAQRPRKSSQAALAANFDPNQPRNSDGEWSKTGSGSTSSTPPTKAEKNAGSYSSDHRAKIGQSGDWRTLGLPAMRDITPDPPITFNKEAEAKARIMRGETVTNPFGEVLHIDQRSMGHIGKKGRDPRQLSDKLQSLDGARETVEHPHEIWLGDNGRRLYIRITAESNGRRVVNAVEQSPDLLLSWHTNPVSYDHYRHGVLQWLRK